MNGLRSALALLTVIPAGGPYDSRDPALVAAQLDAARAAGLDGFVVSWWGRESEEARAFGTLLAAARPTGLRLAPYYEAGELWPRGGTGVAADLEAFLDRHGRAQINRRRVRAVGDA